MRNRVETAWIMAEIEPYSFEPMREILYMGFIATLNFRKFKVALNPMYRMSLNFAKSCILSCLSKFDIKKKIHRAVFEIKALKAKIKGVLAGHTVAMVTYCVTKLILTY